MYFVLPRRLVPDKGTSFAAVNVQQNFLRYFLLKFLIGFFCLSLLRDIGPYFSDNFRRYPSVHWYLLAFALTIAITLWDWLRSRPEPNEV
jgi:hypothetical protein